MIPFMMESHSPEYDYVWAVWKNANVAFHEKPLAASNNLDDIAHIKGILGKTWIRKDELEQYRKERKSNLMEHK